MLVPAATSVGIGLELMLAAREQRAARQVDALARFDKPVVSMTVVMPGPVKNSWLSRRLLAEALQEVEAASDTRGWRMPSREVLWRKTGPEALYVVDVNAQVLKAAMVELEDDHPLGRLWDLDVIAPQQGGLSRQDLGLPARRCLICERPAHVCGRSRAHSLEELLSTIGKIVHDHDRRSAA